MSFGDPPDLPPLETLRPDEHGEIRVPAEWIRAVVADPATSGLGDGPAGAFLVWLVYKLGPVIGESGPPWPELVVRTPGPQLAPDQDRETPEPDFPPPSVAGDPERDADYQHAVRHADAQGYGDGQ